MLPESNQKFVNLKFSVRRKFGTEEKLNPKFFLRPEFTPDIELPIASITQQPLAVAPDLEV
jgi:hypothetical protein